MTSPRCCALSMVFNWFDCRSTNQIMAPRVNKKASLKTRLSFLPLKKYSSSVSLPVSFSNSSSFCFIWSLIKYKSIISITFWINLILFKISAAKKNQMKKKIFVWCDFKKVTFELKLYFARPFATKILSFCHAEISKLAKQPN